LLFETPCYF